MEKTRQIEQKYHVCDFCRKEIDFDKDEIKSFNGDFPTVSIHAEPCLRQAVWFGIEAKNQLPV